VLFKQTHQSWTLLTPIIFFYVIIPLLDLIFGEDESNPPEEVVPELEKQIYYRWITFLMIPLHLFSLYYVLNFIVSGNLSLWMDLVLIYTLGIFGGLAVNLGHEMGHKKQRLDRNLAKLALATPFYGHFNVEHNAGHHRDVATTEDTASSKFGQSIYQFVSREITGGLTRSWKIEKNRLNKKGKSFWSFDNQILHSYALTILIYALFSYFLGIKALYVLLLQIPIAYWQLTSANYIEHYGLLRKKGNNGKYERCQPKHSWNSNHIASNIILFQLQRHSDHHAHPSRHYQSLRHFPEAPQLPTGYMGMFVVAYIPWLWRKIMDPRVMRWANNDLDLVNK
jgi:alkane 1-monooxygenase